MSCEICLKNESKSNGTTTDLIKEVRMIGPQQSFFNPNHDYFASPRQGTWLKRPDSQPLVESTLCWVSD